jgi:hypothetical protein
LQKTGHLYFALTFLRDGAVAHASLDVSEELAVLSYQLVDDFLASTSSVKCVTAIRIVRPPSRVVTSGVDERSRSGFRLAGWPLLPGGERQGTSGRGSATKPLRFGILTAGKECRSRTAPHSIIPLAYSKNADRA